MSCYYDDILHTDRQTLILPHLFNYNNNYLLPVSDIASSIIKTIYKGSPHCDISAMNSK